MIDKNIIHKTLAMFVMVALWSVSSMVALAAPKQTLGELTVSGQVTVDGRAAISNSTVASGSTVATGDNSTATVNLGKMGRIEIMPNSTFALKFDQAGIFGTLNEGKARITTANGTTANVTTRDGIAIADASQSNVFTVEKECGHTHLDTQTGLVTLRGDGNDQQVAAGGTGLAGNQQAPTCKTPCIRPIAGGLAEVPTVETAFGGGAVTALLIGAGAAAALAIILGTRGDGGNNLNLGGGTVVVVSPSR